MEPRLITVISRLTLAAAFALAIFGCATESRGYPMQAWATPASVAYWYDTVLSHMGGVNQGHAAVKAQAYCQALGKNARLSGIRNAGSGMTEVIFDCVSPSM